MAAKLFTLRNVPEDEAADVRELLQEHAIAFYETKAGRWGVSEPAIWLYDRAELDEANALIATYQQQRAARSRAAYQQLKREGRQLTLAGKIRQNPLQFMLLLIMALFILYVSLAPFVHFLSR